MANYNYKAPDLASILANLASLAPQPTSEAQVQPQLPPQESAPSQVPPPNDQYQQILQQQLEQASRLSHAPPPVAAAPKAIDPATITEWSAGLRCVMKTVARHENLLNDIRRVCYLSQISLSSCLQKSDDQSPT